MNTVCKAWIYHIKLPKEDKVTLFSCYFLLLAVAVLMLNYGTDGRRYLSLIHISEPTRPY